MTTIVQVLVSGLTVGSAIALVAVGYNLVFSTSRIVNFAQGPMFAGAGYITFALVREGWSIWMAFIGTIVISMVVGAVIEIVALRPLGRFDPTTNVGWVLTTFSAGAIVLGVVNLTIGSSVRTLPALGGSIFGWKGSVISGVSIAATDVSLILVTLVIAIVMEVLYLRTLRGKAMRAVAQDKQAASLMGINPTLAIMFSFALAGAMAAIAAVMLAPKVFVKLDNAIFLGIQAFVAAVLGGLGSTRGALLGGYTIGFAGAIVKSISPTSARYEELVIFGIFLLVLVVRPTGIMGRRIAEKV